MVGGRGKARTSHRSAGRHDATWQHFNVINGHPCSQVPGKLHAVETAALSSDRQQRAVRPEVMERAGRTVASADTPFAIGAATGPVDCHPDAWKRERAEIDVDRRAHSVVADDELDDSVAGCR